MLKITKIAIRKVIVHLLDNKENNLYLSQRQAIIGADVKDWLAKHIANAMSEDRTRIADFDETITENLIKSDIMGIFKNPKRFVPCSQSCAKHLFQIMQSDKRISPGDMVVVLFSNNKDPDFHIAILKMDPQQIVTHNVEDKKGVKYITLVPGGEGLPSPKQRLQKAAICVNPKARMKYEIIVLDNQIALLEKEGRIANFFAGQFLGCKLTLTDRERTLNIHKHTKKFIEKKFPGQQAFGLNTNLNDIIGGAHHVNVKQLSKQLFDQEDTQKEYMSHLEQEDFLDREFDIDREWVEKHLRKREIRTKEGIRIVGTAVNFKEHLRVEKKGQSKVDITIKNVTYSEKISS